MAAIATSLLPLVERIRPVTLAGEQLLPVDSFLASLLTQEGLLRGTTIDVGGHLGATSLAVALVAEAARAGSWVAVLGLDGLGLTAVEQLGLPLERLVLVASPPPAHWPAVLAALVEGFDVVLAGPPVRVRPVEARRLVARLRERRSLLVQVGWPAHRWPEEPESSLVVSRACWEGIGAGWGHCRARRVEVEAWGKRGAARRRRRWLWLPGPDGLPAAAEPPASPLRDSLHERSRRALPPAEHIDRIDRIDNRIDRIDRIDHIDHNELVEWPGLGDRVERLDLVEARR